MPVRLRNFIQWILLLTCFWLMACTTTTPMPTIALESCYPVSDLSARCGTLTVPENRSQPDARTIDLFLAVLPATGSETKPDPLFFIPGGPGQSAVEVYAQVASAFAQINQNHDIVLLDQRGTGRSHPLDCPESEDDLNTEIDDAALRAYVSACADQLDADLRFYTTTEAVADLDEVRQALGYQGINLYGASYGTRAALAYLRRYPNQVRTVILDGVAPPQFVLGQDSRRDGQRALDLMFERCRTEAACNHHFPNLQAEFKTLLDRLQQSPRELRLAHPVSGEPIGLTFTQEFFTQAVFRLLYSPELVSLLPLLIHTAYIEDDFSALAGQSLILADTTGIYQGMFYSVVCAEDVPFAGTMAVEDEVESYFASALDPLRTACEIWPHGEVPSDFHEPVSTDIPVLLLSGEADPVTPPYYAEQAAATLSNSMHLIAPGSGHITMGRGCTPELTAAFIDDGRLGSLQRGCLENLQPPPFFINFAGPPP